MNELTALVLSRDNDAQAMLRRVLGKVGIKSELCGRPAAGLRLLKSRKYEGVIVDCDDMDCGVDLLALLRDEKFTRTTIVFALVNGRTSMADAFGMGANFVLEKPLALERVQRCFRAAQGLMIGERRRYFRLPVDIPIYLDFPKHFSNAMATVRDVSQGGMLISTPLLLKSEMQGNFRFALPNENFNIEGSCDVVWRADERAGLRFTEMSRICQRRLEKWLHQRFTEMFPHVVPLIADMAEPEELMVQ